MKQRGEKERFNDKKDVERRPRERFQKQGCNTGQMRMREGEAENNGRGRLDQGFPGQFPMNQAGHLQLPPVSMCLFFLGHDIATYSLQSSLLLPL